MGEIASEMSQSTSSSSAASTRPRPTGPASSATRNYGNPSAALLADRQKRPWKSALGATEDRVRSLMDDRREKRGDPPMTDDEWIKYRLP
jgi:hypothetical protein